jgi:hypothetical protein
MAVKASIQITRDGDKPDVGYEWLRRDFDLVFEQTITLSATKTEVKHHLSTIELVYIEKTSDDDYSVYLYKNLSPESWPFDSFFTAAVTGLEQLTLSASGAATVRLFLAGS